MNREFLKGLGLSDEQIESTMKEHGKTIQSVKPDDYDELKTAKATFDKQLKGLQDALDSQKGELGSIEDLKNEVETYKLTNLKTNIAVQAGIPLELAGRLSGATEEEIKADAETMAGFVNKKTPLPLKHTEPSKKDSADQAYANMIDKLT